MPSKSQPYTKYKLSRSDYRHYNLLYLSKLDRSLRQLKNSRCYTDYMLKNSCNLCMRLQQNCRQCKLQLRPSSNQKYSSNKRSLFSCMLSIMKYSSKRNMKQLSPSNTRYCIKSMLKHHCIANIVLILLNRRCILWMPINSNLSYMLSMHLKFNCMYRNLRYQSKQGMKLMSQDNIQQSKQCMHLKFGYSYCIL